MNTYNYQDTQIKATLGVIAGLMQQLQTLAPHPETPDYKGPLFIGNNPAFKAANDQDSTLGMMMLEALVGTAFVDAIGESFGESAGAIAASVDVTKILECYSEYICDVEGQALKNAAHGQGTMARMSGVSISKGFNMRSQTSPQMQAFYEDLPRRMEIERGLSMALTKLNQLAAPAPAYVAAAPRFAA